jgi:hypothetical protein
VQCVQGRPINGPELFQVKRTLSCLGGSGIPFSPPLFQLCEDCLPDDDHTVEVLLNQRQKLGEGGVIEFLLGVFVVKKFYK